MTRECRLIGGIVDQDVEPPELLDRAARRAARQCAGSAISPGSSTALRPGLLDPAGGLFGVLVLVQIGDQHVGALAREGDRDRPADPLIGAGDDRCLALQLALPLYDISPWSGLRVHRLGLAGRLLLLRLEGRLGAGLFRIVVTHDGMTVEGFACFPNGRPRLPFQAPRRGDRGGLRRGRTIISVGTAVSHRRRRA